MNLFSGSLLLILCLLAELVILRVMRKEEVPWREIVYNVSSGHILMWILRAVEVLIFSIVVDNYSLRLLDNWGFPAQWVFTFLGWDFCFYWLHRMHHKIPLFWKIHVVHHQGEHFSLSLGLRNSWYSSLSSIPFFIVLAFIGVPVPVFVSVAAIHYFVQFYNHNGVVGDSGILEKFMVTPAIHRVHHGTNPEYRNKNCGGTLNIWDRLFGTYQKKIEGVEIIYGVEGAIKTDNPFWGNNLPFMEALKMKLPEFNISENKKFNVSDFYIASGGLIVLALWLYYIYFEGQGLVLHQSLLFSLVFIATVALGSLSDGRLAGMIGWIILTLVPSIAYAVYFDIYKSWSIIFFVLFFVHGLYGMKLTLEHFSKSKLSNLET